MAHQHTLIICKHYACFQLNDDLSLLRILVPRSMEDNLSLLLPVPRQY